MKLMKRLFIFLLIILCSRSYGQFPLVFVDPPEKTVCRGGTVTFVATISDTVPDPADYIYEFKWLFNNVVIPDSTRKYLVVKNINRFRIDIIGVERPEGRGNQFYTYNV